MKIAVFDNLPEGGAKRVLFEQIKYLAQDHSIDWYTNKRETIFQIGPFVENKFQFNLELVNYRSIFRPLKEISLLTKINLKYRWIAHQINSANYDLVLVHPCQLTQAPWLLQFLNKPSLYFMEETLRTFYEPELFLVDHLPIFNRLYEKLRRLIIAQIDLQSVKVATKLMTSSQYVASQVKKNYHRLAEVNHLGVDTKVFKAVKNKKPKHFLFVGDKNDINGYQLINDLEKTIREDLSHKISFGKSFPIKYLQFGQQNKFKLSDLAVAKQYQESYATLCLSFNEPFGLTALESMACGTTVIAVNEGGYQETIKDKDSGLLIRRDFSKLAQTMKIIMENSKLRSQLEKSGIKRVSKDFTWRLHGQRLEKQLLLLSNN
ncbi:MAG: glycosyltransferase family 4 protein [Candidatus Beckwithbacteria bacterium]|nr:glycosyltransferase family 4 protein [Patescibacteria group bacterium]